MYCGKCIRKEIVIIVNTYKSAKNCQKKRATKNSILAVGQMHFDHKSDYVDWPVQWSCKLALSQMESFQVGILSYCSLQIFIEGLLCIRHHWANLWQWFFANVFCNLFWYVHQRKVISKPILATHSINHDHPVILKFWTPMQRMVMNMCSAFFEVLFCLHLKSMVDF